MIYTQFISSIPKDLEDAAAIDGTNPLQYFWSVILPLAKVPIASVTVIMLPWFWNDFLQPYIYLEDTYTTLLPLITNLPGNIQPIFKYPLPAYSFPFCPW